MHSAKVVAVVVGLCGWTFVACDQHSDSGSPPATTSSPVVTNPEPQQPPPPTNDQLGRQIYAMRCLMCHGVNGKGDGKMAASLSPKPRDYSDPAWQASVSDDDVRKVILGGGPAVGKSAVMPANADLEQTPDMVDALVHLVRGFVRDAGAAPNVDASAGDAGHVKSSKPLAH